MNRDPRRDPRFMFAHSDKNAYLYIPYLLYNFYSYSLLGTCIVLAVKYNEEVCFFNDGGKRFFYDREFAPVIGIPKS
jgi:hypothetical protein